MANSYEKINYSLRPAKTIERKMFCEAMHKLSHFQNIETYQYVGFGSTYFSDFTLIHRMLGIKKMTSIEKDIQNSQRFRFNKPYSCIEMIFKFSNDALNDIDWSVPVILWLDYDSKLNYDMFKDINTFFSQACPSSMFILTIDIKPDEPPKEKKMTNKEKKVFRRKELIKRVGHIKLPDNIYKRALGIAGNRKLVYDIVNDQIAEALSIQNGVIQDPENKINYQQIFNIYYNDGTPMLTIGGIIFQENQRQIVETAKFNDLEFYTDSSKSFKIEVPSLTFKEIYTLNELLPNHVDKGTGKIDPSMQKKSKLPELSDDDVKKYAKVYRYFPTFAETNF